MSVTSTADVLLAPVHRDEGLALEQRRARLRRQDDRASPALDADEVAVIEAEVSHIVGGELNDRLGIVTEEAACGPRAAHAVPLISDASGGQGQGIKRVYGLRDRVKGCIDEASAAFALPLPAGPLHRPVFEQRVGHPREVEVTASRRLAVFHEDRLAVGVREERAFRQAFHRRPQS